MKYLASVLRTLAVAILSLFLFSAIPAYSADAPTLHYDGATCPNGNSQLNIDALGPAFEKVKDKMKGPNPRIIYIDGADLVKFDAALQAAGGPAKPDVVKGMAFIIYDGWDSANENPITLLTFDSDGCLIQGHLVVAKFLLDGQGRGV